MYQTGTDGADNQVDFYDGSYTDGNPELTSFSGSNTNVSTASTSSYDNDAVTFYGTLDLDTKQLEVWHEVRRSEQTVDD